MRTRSRPAVRVARRRARARGGPRGLVAPRSGARRARGGPTSCAPRRRACSPACPRLEARESVAARVLDRLEMEAETRRPALAVLFRGFAAARPFILPSLVPAALVLVSVLAGVLALDSGPAPRGAPRARGLGCRAGLGHGGQPALPVRGRRRCPRETAALDLSPEVLAGRGEGSLFVETVVARDGSVAGVTVLQGERATARRRSSRPCAQQRYEPVRYRGRPVAVSVYRLISRMEVERRARRRRATRRLRRDDRLSRRPRRGDDRPRRRRSTTRPRRSGRAACATGGPTGAHSAGSVGPKRASVARARGRGQVGDPGVVAEEEARARERGPERAQRPLRGRRRLPATRPNASSAGPSTRSHGRPPDRRRAASAKRSTGQFFAGEPLPG